MANPRINRWIRVLLLGGCLASSLPTACAAPVSAADAEFFTSTIQPILSEHCHKCHSHSSDKIKGGLVVDSLAGLLKGGDTAPAVVPGNLDKSLLIAAIHYTNEDLQMPPKGKKLSADQIAALEKWVQLGAPWPGQDPAKAVAVRGKFSEEDRQWWSFQPLKESSIPEVEDQGWCRNSIDHFVFRKLQSEGLKPSPDGEKRSLIRRVYFDLWGLPPSPEEVESFVSDSSPAAYEHLIDRLLDSPRYGERWARHWLDLVRYAESDGYRIDDYRPNTWPYRDYVIQAFNDDKPYNRFVQEQLAGDELEPENPQMYVANSFLRLWIYEYNNRDARQQWTTILNDMTDVAGDVFLGLGMQCARCHDHKFDPILQKDYYRLQAFFASFQPRQDMVLASPKQLAEYKQQLGAWEKMTAEVREEIAQLEQPYRDKAAKDAAAKFPEDIQALLAKPKPERTPYEEQIASMAFRQITHEWDRLDGRIKGADKEKLNGLRKELAKFDPFKPKPFEKAFTVTDVGPTPPPLFIPKKKEPIEPGYLTILDEKPATIQRPAHAPNSTGRRSELARWLTQPENPLTTRVIVNRIWQYHFGRGLVSTSSDFGRLGEKPSNPELLDWLAVRFTKDGWSFKKMHRLILLSSTYRQSALTSPSETARLKDPENRLLWRMNIRRLDAEQVRDAMLAATGELDPNMGGPAVDTAKPRRSVYTRVMRNTHDPLLEVFDSPEAFASTSLRNVTTTPTQALFMFNSQYTLARARALAARLKESSVTSEEEMVQRAYQLVFGRPPSQTEQAAAVKFLRQDQKQVAPLRATSVTYMSEKMPYREDKAAVMSPSGPMDRFEVPDSPALPQRDFTVEAFVLLRSVYEDGQVRTIASHWDGHNKHPGWAFGVTSKKSMNKPQTLVLQLCGQGKKGTEYEPVFSGLNLELNRPYFVAISVKLNQTNENGINFFAKDLSNDDEPMQSAHVAHAMTLPLASHAEFVMGGREGQNSHLWDGLIDDVRLSNMALRQEQLLLTSEGITENTVGYWQFESASNYHRDSSGHGLNIKIKMAAPKKQDPEQAALVDFCHVLLNANEFLYVE